MQAVLHSIWPLSLCKPHACITCMICNQHQLEAYVFLRPDLDLNSRRSPLPSMPKAEYSACHLSFHGLSLCANHMHASNCMICNQRQREALVFPRPDRSTILVPSYLCDSNKFCSMPLKVSLNVYEGWCRLAMPLPHITCAGSAKGFKFY